MAWMMAASLGMQALGGLLGSRSARRAARERAAAFGEAGNIARQAFEESSAFLDPRFQQEQAAIERVNALLGLGGQAPDFDLFRETPGFQFALEEGQRAVERSAAAGGGLVSGNTLAELTRLGTGLAEQTFQNYLATLLGLQSQGVDLTLADMRTGLGDRLAEFRLGAGGARAAGREEGTNALIGALSGAASIVGQRAGINQLASLLRPQTGGSAARLAPVTVNPRWRAVPLRDFPSFAGPSS